MSARSRVRALSPAAVLGAAALFSAGTPIVIGAVLAPSAQAAATASITKLDPQDVFTVGNDLVFIEGTGLNTVTGVTVDGASQDFADEGDGTLSFFTPELPKGTHQVRLVTAGGTTADNGTIDDLNYTDPPPVPIITSVTPNFGPLAGGNRITLKGSNFKDAQGVVFGAFALADDFTVVSDTELTVAVPKGEKNGVADIRVINLGGSNDNTAADDYTYGGTGGPGIPAVTSIAPNNGPAGTVVTINGTALGSASVKFGDQASTKVTQVSATQITAVAPGGSGTVNVIVSTPGGASPNTAADDYTYPAPTPVATVTGISPASGTTAGGTVVTVTGTGLNTAQAVTFGGVPGTSLTAVSATQLKITAPAHAAGKVDVLVTNGSGASVNTAADDYTYVTPPPAVSSISPATGSIYGGTVVTVNGSNLAGTTGVKFDGVAGTSVTNVSASQIKVTSPAHAAGNADIVVTTASGSSANVAADNFSYFVPAPVVTSISPASGPTAGGTAVDITGQNLENATVKFGNSAPIAAQPAVGGPFPATKVRVTSPAGATGTVDVIVTTPGGSSANTAGDNFTYVPPTPAITGIAPASGSTAGGTSVTISGTNLTGATGVKFGSANGTGLVVDSATQARVTSPAGSGTVDVSITTTGGTSAAVTADKFTYVVPAPAVTAISPSGGLPAGGTVVTITGTNLAGATGVKFGSAAASAVTVVSATQVKATSPAGSVGTVDVSVTTPGGTSANTGADDFTYADAPVKLPVITGYTPTSGLPAGGTVITITGTDLGGTTGVKFGDVDATNVTQVSDTQVKATSPAGTGVVAVSLTNGNGTAVGTTKFTYTSVSPLAPTVRNVFPNSGIAYIGGIVTLQGTNFRGVRSVRFGSRSAQFVVVGNTIVAFAPGQAKGIVPVTVTTVFGVSPPNSRAKYTYLGF